MTSQQYEYAQSAELTTNSTPTKVNLTTEQTAGHGDHWNIFTNDIEGCVPAWLQKSIDNAVIASGLHTELNKDALDHLIISGNELCHINQILAMDNGAIQNFINAYPCVNSPYGLSCRIERIIVNEECHDAVLRLVSEDGSVIYAFDQLYSVNADLYEKDTAYFVNFSALAYRIKPSNKDEVIVVEDPEAIRYHRAFNDIVAKNNGVTPTDIDQQINDWQPETDAPLAPVEINLGHMCAYLFGETLGQEDEAWCQGQVLGKQTAPFFENSLTVLDVAILREPDATPFVVRMATPTTDYTNSIDVNDYIQANIWLQAAIYKENQS